MNTLKPHCDQLIIFMSHYPVEVLENDDQMAKSEFGGQWCPLPYPAPVLPRFYYSLLLKTQENYLKESISYRETSRKLIYLD